jgi:hypothetical protein
MTGRICGRKAVMYPIADQVGEFLYKEPSLEIIGPGSWRKVVNKARKLLDLPADSPRRVRSRFAFRAFPGSQLGSAVVGVHGSSSVLEG